MTAERRLAAILSADLVGYSRLMADDEEATVRTLSAYRQQVGMLVPEHRGRVVDFTGDNFLAEFPTATDAIEAAVEIQRVLQARNAALPADRAMDFRIGVHLGEVRDEDGRLYGDGVNIAARLEGLAGAGEICISDDVRHQIRRRLEIEFDDLGERELKNIPDPVRAFRIRIEASGAPARRPRRAVAVAAGSLILLSFVALGGWRWLQTRAADDAPAATELTVPGFSGRPAIAVLAFDNLSGDSEQDYFADGIAEDLISRLSVWRRHPVIARNSSFVYKGRAVDVKQVSHELGVRYVVEGSVRRSGDRVRITAQLIDATTGHHVWADSFDRELNDIFALQDEISLAIATAINPEIQVWEMRRAAGSEPQSLDAWDRVQQGWWHFSKLTPDGNERAQALFLSAIDLDPLLAPAWTGLAWTHYNYVFLDTSVAARGRAEMLAAAERAVELDPHDAQALCARGAALGMAGDADSMRADIARALEENPSDAMAHYWRAVVLSGTGHYDEAVSHADRAMRLSPRDPWFFLFLDSAATAHFGAMRYAEAAKSAQAAARHRPDYPFARALLASSYAWTGRLDEARSEAQRILADSPGFSIANVREGYALTRPELVDRLVEGLRRAGLPDQP